MLCMGDIKLYALNGMALGVTTFTKLEMSLKIILLLITIGYTMDKWIKAIRNGQNK